MMGLEELIRALIELQATQGDLPVVDDNERELSGAEFNEDEEPCVVLTFFDN